jgi:hypothetical protein
MTVSSGFKTQSEVLRKVSNKFTLYLITESKASRHEQPTR